MLSVANDWNLGAVPSVANSASITLNGGVLQLTGSSAFEVLTFSKNRGITLGASGGTINVTRLGTGTFNTSETAVQYAGVIGGPGNLTITGGSGTNSGAAPYLLELGAASTYGGGGGTTTISNATVSFQNNGNLFNVNALPPTTVLNVVSNGWFVLNNGVAMQTVAGLTGDASGVVMTTNGGSANLTITPSAGQTYTFPGMFGAQTVLGKGGANTAMSLVINGSGTQVFSGSSDPYAGVTIINGGSLQLNNNANGAAGEIGSGVITINSGGGLVLNAANVLCYSSTANTLVINSGGAVTNTTSASHVTIQNLLTMTGGASLTGTGTGDASGAYVFGNGTLGILATSDSNGNPAVISSPLSSQANLLFTVNRGTLAPASDLTVSGAIMPYNTSGTAGLVKSGNGIMTLIAANTYTAHDDQRRYAANRRRRRAGRRQLQRSDLQQRGPGREHQQQPDLWRGHYRRRRPVSTRQRRHDALRQQRI